MLDGRGTQEVCHDKSCATSSNRTGWSVRQPFPVSKQHSLTRSVEARRTTGSWSPLKVVDYHKWVPGGRLALLAAGLAVWFLLLLLVSMAFLDARLAQNVFSWLPNTLLQFALVEGEAGPVGGGAMVAFLVIAFAFNGVAGPIAEELYFRGHLLPRLERYGRWAPVLNTVLFALYHFFSPWRYPAIILGFLPIAWMAWRERSVIVSIAAHITINMITVVLLLSALLAPGNWQTRHRRAVLHDRTPCEDRRRSNAG